MPLLHSGALQPLLVEWIAPGPPLNVVYPSSRYLTAKVRAFSEFVADVFPKRYVHAKGEQGWWAEVAAMAAAQRQTRPRSRLRR